MASRNAKYALIKFSQSTRSKSNTALQASNFSRSGLNEYPLHAAAREGRLEELRNLICSSDRPMDVNQGTYDLLRPLHEACLAGQYECTVLLHKYGADVNLRNIDGGTPLSDACSKGSLECIRYLLENGAVVNPPFVLTTPLHEAVLSNNWHCLPLLLHYGANMEASDLECGSPLQTAIKNGFVECAAILLQAGANVNTSKAHQTPLHTAASIGDMKLVELLLEHGANVYAQNSRGLTPKQLVPNHSPVCRLLLDAWETTPNSLRHLCRLKIREAVGPERMMSLSFLQLPRLLTKFLEFV